MKTWAWKPAMTVCGKGGRLLQQQLQAGCLQVCSSVLLDGHCVFAQQCNLKQLLCSSHFLFAHCKILVHNCSSWRSLALPKASTDPSRSILPTMLTSKCTLIPGSLTSLQSNEVAARPFPPHTSPSWQRIWGGLSCTAHGFTGSLGLFALAVCW